MNPLVSVVIPAFNAGAFIGEALESVRAQSYRPLEVIVVDDGSTDDTGAVVERFAAEDGTGLDVRYFHQENGGPSKARNVGIKAAQGEFIALLDADDRWCQSKLQLQMELFEQNESVDLTFCNVRFIRNGQPCGVMFGDDGGATSFKYDHGVVLDPVTGLLKENFVNTSAVIARRRCFQSGFSFNENRKYAEDWELWLKIAERFSLGYVPEVCVLESQREGSLSSNGTEMMLSGIEVVEDFLRHHFSVDDVGAIVEPEYRAILFNTYKWAGYHLMMHGDSAAARQMFIKAFRLRCDVKTIGYYLYSFCR